MSGLKTPPKAMQKNTRLQTFGFCKRIQEQSTRLLKCYFLNSHHSFPLLSTQSPRLQTEKSTKQEMCFIYSSGLQDPHSTQLTAHTCQQAPKLKNENSFIFQSPCFSCFRRELLVPVRVYPLFPWACDSSMYKTRACAGFGRAAANGSTKARRPRGKPLTPWVPVIFRSSSFSRKIHYPVSSLAPNNSPNITG